MQNVVTSAKESTEARRKVERDDQSICKNETTEKRLCQKAPFLIFPIFDVIAKVTAPKKCWSVINITSNPSRNLPQCLHYDKATLWVKNFKTRDATYFIKERTPFSLLYTGRIGERKILTIEAKLQTKKQRNAGIISVTITKKGNFEIIADSQVLDDRNNNQLIVNKRKVEIKIDREVLTLTHCNDEGEVYVPDKVLDDYDVVGIMAQTKLSKVYQIKKKTDNNEVHVIKVERNFKVSANESLLPNEIEILKKFPHDNIIKLISADMNPLQHYLIIEYATGGDLSRFMLNNKNRTEANARVIFKQVLSAISHLHRNNIVHRDIKPKNIVLMAKDSLESVKLIDFGLSCTLPESLQPLSSVAGTYAFMSPIMLGNHLHDYYRGYNEKTDIFSFGVTLYLFLTRELPFMNSNDLYAYHREMMEGKLKRNTGKFLRLSDPTQTLIIDCLEPRQCLRPDAESLLKYEMWNS